MCITKYEIKKFSFMAFHINKNNNSEGFCQLNICPEKSGPDFSDFNRNLIENELSNKR